MNAIFTAVRTVPAIARLFALCCFSTGRVVIEKFVVEIAQLTELILVRG